MTPATDADLGGPLAGPRQLVKTADANGWWTIVTVGEGMWATREKDDDEEPVMRHETSLVVRGVKDGRRFVAIWRTIPSLATQPPAVCYWWTCLQRGRIERDPQTSRDVAFDVAVWKQAHDGKISAPKERELRARAYETVEWVSDRPFPRPVLVTDLKKLLAGGIEWTELPTTSVGVRAGSAGRSARAVRTPRTDGVS